MKRLSLLFTILLAVLCIAAFGVDTVSTPEAVDTVSSPAYVDGVEGTITVSGCVAEYSYESADIKADNHTTNGNDFTYCYGDANTTYYKEGSQSIYFDGTEYCTLADGSLSSDFPTKNGTSNDTFSVATWFRTDDTNIEGADVIVSKYNWLLGGLRSWAFGLYENGTEDIRAFLRIGYADGASSQTALHGTDLTTGALASSAYYFACWTFDNTSTDTTTYPYQIMVRDSSCSVVGSDVSADITLDSSGISIKTSSFTTGAAAPPGDYFKGIVDRTIIFGNDKILTPTECTQLCNGASVSYD